MKEERDNTVASPITGNPTNLIYDGLYALMRQQLEKMDKLQNDLNQIKDDLGQIKRQMGTDDWIAADGEEDDESVTIQKILDYQTEQRKILMDLRRRKQEQGK